jgi:hypothetical protein
MLVAEVIALNASTYATNISLPEGLWNAIVVGRDLSAGITRDRLHVGGAR